MWFEELTGFTEQGAAQLRQLMIPEPPYLISKANGRKLKAGMLTTPSLAVLQQEANNLSQVPGWEAKPLTLAEVVADVQLLHVDKANAGALFQVASQFNLLEMISPEVTPEDGITGYQFDGTQGPACAMACGAGLIYRNYFAEVNGETGQCNGQQLDMLDAFGPALQALIEPASAKVRAGTLSNSPWQMKNGYALPSESQLIAINKLLASLLAEERAALTGLIKIGVQQDTQVTLSKCQHTVSQAYCSAMPVAYSQHSSELWQPLASLMLQAAYEATLAAGVMNAARTGNNTVFLTLLGGGAFGNAISWIIQAISSAVAAYKDSGLNVKIVSYGCSNAKVQQLLTSWR